ncbi:MAG: MFS transporter [Halobacteriales archaeon]
MRRPSLDAVHGFDRAVYVVAAGQLINVFGAGMVYPFATVHFHFQVGISLAMVGTGLLARNVATAVATAVGGYWADRHGRKPVMVASMAGNALTLAAYASVPAIAAATLLSPGWAFVAVSAAAGLTAGLYAPAGQAYTADLTEGPDRDRAFSLLKVANNVGFGSGFVVGGVLYEFASVAVFVADGATSAVVALVLLVAVGRVHEGRDDAALRDAVGDWGVAITKRRVLALAALNVGFAVLYAQMQTTVPVVAKDWLGLDASQLGTLYVLNPLTLVLLQIPVVDAIASWRRTRGLVVSTGFWAVSMLAVWLVFLLDLPVLAGVALVGAHLVLRTLGEILHSPLVTSLMSDLGTARERGSQLSLLEVAKRLGFGVGSFVGGLFFDSGLGGLLWPALAVASVGLAVGLLALERRVTPAENGVEVAPG